MHPIILAAALAFSAMPFPYKPTEVGVPNGYTAHINAFSVSFVEPAPPTQNGGAIGLEFTPPREAKACVVSLDLGRQYSHDISDTVLVPTGGLSRSMHIHATLPSRQEIDENGFSTLSEWRVYAYCVDKEMDDVWFSQMYRSPIPTTS